MENRELKINLSYETDIGLLVQSSEKLMRKWKRFLLISQVFRIFAMASSTVLILVYCVLAWKMNKAWYSSLYELFIGVAFLILLYGVLVLLLKPIFYLTRRKAQKVHLQLTDLENKLFDLEISSIACYERDELEKPIKVAIRKHKTTSETIYSASANLRELKMAKAKYDEWAWVINAVAAILIIVALAITTAIIAVLIGLLMVSMLFYNGADDYHTYDDYSDPTQEQKSLLTIVVSPIYGKIREYRYAIKETKNLLKNKMLKKEKLRIRLGLWGITPVQIAEPFYLIKYKPNEKDIKCSNIRKENY